MASAYLVSEWRKKGQLLVMMKLSMPKNIIIGVLFLLFHWCVVTTSSLYAASTDTTGTTINVNVGLARSITTPGAITFNYTGNNFKANDTNPTAQTITFDIEADSVTVGTGLNIVTAKINAAITGIALNVTAVNNYVDNSTTPETGFSDAEMVEQAPFTLGTVAGALYRVTVNKSIAVGRCSFNLQPDITVDQSAGTKSATLILTIDDGNA